MKNESGTDRFVAHGEESIRSSETFKKKEQEIKRRIYEETLSEWTSTPWWKKPLMKWKVEKRIQKELDRLAPPDALYLQNK